MKSHELDIYFSKAHEIAVHYRHEYVTREHFFAALLKDREVIRAFRDLDVPIPFIRERLNDYFKKEVESVPDTVPEDELGKPTDALHALVANVLNQALGSGRNFPRAIDFIIALCHEKHTFIRSLFNAMNYDGLQFMEWAARHPERKQSSASDDDKDIDDDDVDENDDDEGFDYEGLFSNDDDGAEFIDPDDDEDEDEDDEEDNDDDDDDDEESDSEHKHRSLARGIRSFLSLVENIKTTGERIDNVQNIKEFKDVLRNTFLGKDAAHVDIRVFRKNFGPKAPGSLREILDFGEEIDISDENGAKEAEDNAPQGDETSQRGASKRREDLIAFRRIRGFVTKLVERASRGEIDPVVGREKEIETCCLALLRRTKSNVLIVGEAGVGKTAIVEGLARAIARKEVPLPLQDLEIYSLDVASLMAGTKLRGEMEERLKAVMHYVETHQPAVLFIDELHSVSGTERSGGAQEIMGLLKPKLATGALRVIGTTTYDDYRRNIASDTALVRRFHKLDIEEPNADTTRFIIESLKPHYAEFHHVDYTDEALNAAVSLTAKHIPERRFPDKAIDIIDEAGAYYRMTRTEDETELKTIDREDIEKIVAKVARIPDIQVSHDEGELLKNAEERIKSSVFGQDAAIEALVRLIKLSRAGIRAEQKPVANLLFAGPTGVGKTEVARQFAKALNLPFVRFDMSEYREEYSISKFIGASPGYVGYDRGGLLTEAIRSKPNCVLLLDEIEKAHSAIFDLLLQVMDAASLTDNTGKTADFRNVTLIMTSNSGSVDMGRMSIGFDSKIDVSNGLKEIEKTFSPEFRNRLDEVILFNALSPESMASIVKRMVGDLSLLLAERNVTISITEGATQWFAKEGYDPKFGARPMARLIQKEISVPLSDEILFGQLKSGGKVEVDWDESSSKIAFRIESSPDSSSD